MATKKKIQKTDSIDILKKDLIALAKLLNKVREYDDAWDFEVIDPADGDILYKDSSDIVGFGPVVRINIHRPVVEIEVK